PGPLTVICRAQPTLAWDLGDTGGTVALRMPDDEVALALLPKTGPLAVSGANRHGGPAATTVQDAATALGDRVEVYLDGGPSRGGAHASIVDRTGTAQLAVSSANRHGGPAATTVLQAATALGDRVEVFLDGGPSRGGVHSTIVDATGTPPRIVRAGALSREELAAVVPDIEGGAE